MVIKTLGATVNGGLNLDDRVSGTVWDYHTQPTFIRHLLSINH